MNGGLWNGDLGVTRNPHGQAQGYVKGIDYDTGANNVIGNNSTMGGSLSYCSNAIQSIKNWGRPWLSKSCPQIANEPGQNSYRVYGTQNGWGDFLGIRNDWDDKHVISSRTHVVKDGACGTGTTREKWSAFGVSPDRNRNVFVSSSDLGKTNASELCRIFQSLGVMNAILLDGGSSTQLVLDGHLLSPMNAMDRLAFGSLNRPVAYGIGVRGRAFPRRNGNYTLKNR